MLKKQNYTLIALVVVGAVIAVWKLWPDARPNEEQIKSLVENVIAGANEGRVSAVVDPLAEEFEVTSARGSSMSRGELRRLLAAQFLRGGVDVRVPLISIDSIEGKTARVSFRALLTRGGLRGAAGGQAKALKVELDLRQDSGEWTVTSASYEDAL